MELELKIAGINYWVRLDIEEEYVSGVLEVGVFDGEEITIPLYMSDKDLVDFYERYEDELNEAYQSEMVARAELAAEEKWERENDR